MSNGRKSQVIDTFLAVTETLVSDFDPLEMLTMLAERSTELLDVSAAGIILTDGNGGGLSVAAASSERSRLLEVFAVAIDAGPCLDCVRSGEPVIGEDLASSRPGGTASPATPRNCSAAPAGASADAAG